MTTQLDITLSASRPFGWKLTSAALWLAVCLFTVLLTAGQVQAATYTIRSNSDFNTYFGFSPSVPLQPGDTVNIAAGNYSGIPMQNPGYQNIILWKLHGNPGTGGWITVQAADGWNDVTLNLSGLGLSLSNCSFIRISNITIAGAGLDATTNVPSEGPADHDIQFVGCTVHDSSGSGISVNGSGSLVEACIVYSCCSTAANGTSGIDVYEPLIVPGTDNSHFASDNSELGNPNNTYSLIIRNNTVYSNQMNVPETGFGIPVDGNGIILDKFNYPQDNEDYPGRTLVANNVIAFNGGSGCFAFHTKHVDMLNNTSFHNCRNVNGVELGAGETDSSDIYLYNNICIADGGGVDPNGNQTDTLGLCARQDAGIWSDHNYASFYNFNGNTNFLAQGSSNLAGWDPKFANPSIGDFHIPAGSGSPCLGTGLSLWQLNYDRDNNPRNSAYDIGAYQDPPAPPTGLKATAGAAGTKKITVTWTAGKFATGYKVYRSASSGGAYTLLATVSGTSYVNTGLTAGTTYYYKVASTDAESDSVKVGPVSAKAQ